MGNTLSTKSKKGFLTKPSKHIVGTTNKDTELVTTMTRATTRSSSSTANTTPIKMIRSDSPTNNLEERKNSKGNLLTTASVLSNGISSLPPSPTQSDLSTCKELKSAETLIIHGRRYQNVNKKYILPSDDQEQDRLVQVHFIYKYIFGGNFSAPVRGLLSGAHQEYHRKNSTEWALRDTPPPRVLDVACGNGTWILEMATEYPDSHFYGIDFATNYPTTVKPSNTFFSQHDVLSPKGLPFPDSYFDYVHMRQVYTCFSVSDWTTVVKEIKRVVKPGGYVEFRDIDPMLKNMGPITTKLFKTYPSMMKERQGVDVFWSRCMFDYLQNVGEMTDMHRQIYALRFGINTGPVGDMTHTSLRSGLESYRLFFMKCNSESLTDADYDKMIDDIVEETIQRHSFFNYYLCWGRKPLFDYQENIPKRYSPVNNGKPVTPNSNYHNGVHPISRHPSSPSAIITPTNLSPVTLDQNTDKSNPFMPTLSTFAWENKSETEGASLGSDNVSDIDQFVEGFED